MTKQHHSTAVFIGRFQPFHNGHLHALRRALTLADNVLVLIGSAVTPRTPKNPFDYEERVAMIEASLTDSERMRVKYDYLVDHPYNDHEWISQVQECVAEVERDNDRVILVGHEKDDSSYYLKVFPQWKHHDTGYEQLNGDMELNIDATRIREYAYEGRLQYALGLVPSGTLNMLLKYTLSPWFADIAQEYRDVKEYRKSWEVAPYPPTFVTVDSVVIQSGHVLMVRRGKNPGKGLWALPGGFVEPNETLFDAAVRELIEETNIRLQPDVLRRCLRATNTFDSPSRDTRGRTFTHAHVFSLNNMLPLPAVKAGDDAAECKWIPLAELDPEMIYSDHYAIIRTMMGRI